MEAAEGNQHRNTHMRAHTQPPKDKDKEWDDTRVPGLQTAFSAARWRNGTLNRGKSGCRDNIKMKHYPTYVDHTIYSKLHYSSQLGATGAPTCVSKCVKMTQTDLWVRKKKPPNFTLFLAKRWKKPPMTPPHCPHRKNSWCWQPAVTPHFSSEDECNTAHGPDAGKLAGVCIVSSNGSSSRTVWTTSCGIVALGLLIILSGGC